MPRYDIPRVLERVRLDDLVAERVGAGRRVGGRTLYHCPHPSHPDAHPSFDVDERRQTWHCRSRCDAWGDAIDLLVWLDGMSKADAIAYLAERYGIEPEPGTGRRSPGIVRRFVPTPPPAPVVNLVGQSTDKARPVTGPAAVQLLDAFLASRGWSRATAEAVGLTVVRSWDGYRVRFPFLRDGVALVWQDRAVEPSNREPKWAAPKGAELYPFGLDYLARYNGPPDTWPTCPVIGRPAVWLCEGPADAVTLLERFPTVSVLALPGAKAWKPQYADALEGLPVFLVADNDAEGESLRATVSSALTGRSELAQVRLPEHCNDVNDWHLVAGDGFADELLAAVDDALAARQSGVTA